MCFAGAVRIDFQASAAPTIGVEWEFALVDRETRDLSNTAVDLLAAARPLLPDPARLHQELLRNTVEVVTGVCPTVRAAADDLRSTLEVVLGSTDAVGVDLMERAPTPSPPGPSSSSPPATATRS